MGFCGMKDPESSVPVAANRDFDFVIQVRPSRTVTRPYQVRGGGKGSPGGRARSNFVSTKGSPWTTRDVVDRRCSPVRRGTGVVVSVAMIPTS